MVRGVRLATVVLGAAATFGGVAHADPPTSRAYAIELYDGVAYGNSATVAMGGAAVGNAVGSSGTLANASAPAVRETTDSGVWSWDYHLDALSSSLSSDFDNNGRLVGDGGASVLTAGLVVRRGDWAVGATATYETIALVGATATIDGQATALDAKGLRGRFAVARYVPQLDLALGAAIDIAELSIVPTCAGCANLFAISGGGASLGATWLPSRESWRVGASASTEFHGGNVEVSSCDPMACAGYVLPQEVVSPWRVAVGAAYRLADTAWNQLVGGYWRDERALTLAADLEVVGASPNAYGLEAFGQHDLQRAGRHVGVSPRAGLEYEWLPGRLRLRVGGYFEPARYDGVDGRLHATFGIEVRALQVQLFGSRRGRITLTGDVAPRYSNVGVSIGFWH